MRGAHECHVMSLRASAKPLTPPRSWETRPRPKSPKDGDKKGMTTDEWIKMHLRRAPERDEEWVRRALVLQGRA
ncbi:hypothetical protein SAVCW2_35040 [Streptomyces avermitilis]|nr:hypothetical protein SAVCW2_35040 [Streptomyces avermitilis]